METIILVVIGIGVAVAAIGFLSGVFIDPEYGCQLAIQATLGYIAVVIVVGISGYFLRLLLIEVFEFLEANWITVAIILGTTCLALGGGTYYIRRKRLIQEFGVAKRKTTKADFFEK